MDSRVLKRGGFNVPAPAKKADQASKGQRNGTSFALPIDRQTCCNREQFAAQAVFVITVPATAFLPNAPNFKAFDLFATRDGAKKNRSKSKSSSSSTQGASSAAAEAAIAVVNSTSVPGFDDENENRLLHETHRGHNNFCYPPMLSLFVEVTARTREFLTRYYSEQAVEDEEGKLNFNGGEGGNRAIEGPHGEGDESIEHFQRVIVQHGDNDLPLPPDDPSEHPKTGFESDPVQDDPMVNGADDDDLDEDQVAAMMGGGSVASATNGKGENGSSTVSQQIHNHLTPSSVDETQPSSAEDRQTDLAGEKSDSAGTQEQPASSKMALKDLKKRLAAMKGVLPNDMYFVLEAVPSTAEEMKIAYYTFWCGFANPSAPNVANGIMRTMLDRNARMFSSLANNEEDNGGMYTETVSRYTKQSADIADAIDEEDLGIANRRGRTRPGRGGGNSRGAEGIGSGPLSRLGRVDASAGGRDLQISMSLKDIQITKVDEQIRKNRKKVSFAASTRKVDSKKDNSQGIRVKSDDGIQDIEFYPGSPFKTPMHKSYEAITSVTEWFRFVEDYYGFDYFTLEKQQMHNVKLLSPSERGSFSNVFSPRPRAVTPNTVETIDILKILRKNGIGIPDICNPKQKYIQRVFPTEFRGNQSLLKAFRSNRSSLFDGGDDDSEAEFGDVYSSIDDDSDGGEFSTDGLGESRDEKLLKKAAEWVIVTFPRPDFIYYFPHGEFTTNRLFCTLLIDFHLTSFHELEYKFPFLASFSDNEQLKIMEMKYGLAQNQDLTVQTRNFETNVEDQERLDIDKELGLIQRQSVQSLLDKKQRGKKGKKKRRNNVSDLMDQERTEELDITLKSRKDLRKQQMDSLGFTLDDRSRLIRRAVENEKNLNAHEANVVRDLEKAGVKVSKVHNPLIYERRRLHALRGQYKRELRDMYDTAYALWKRNKSKYPKPQKIKFDPSIGQFRDIRGEPFKEVLFVSDEDKHFANSEAQWRSEALKNSLINSKQVFRTRSPLELIKIPTIVFFLQDDTKRGMEQLLRYEDFANKVIQSEMQKGNLSLKVLEEKQSELRGVITMIKESLWFMMAKRYIREAREHYSDVSKTGRIINKAREEENLYDIQYVHEPRDDGEISDFVHFTTSELLAIRHIWEATPGNVKPIYLIANKCMDSLNKRQELHFNLFLSSEHGGTGKTFALETIYSKKIAPCWLIKGTGDYIGRNTPASFQTDVRDGYDFDRNVFCEEFLKKNVGIGNDADETFSDILKEALSGGMVQIVTYANTEDGLRGSRTVRHIMVLSLTVATNWRAYLMPDPFQSRFHELAYSEDRSTMDIARTMYESAVSRIGGGSGGPNDQEKDSKLRHLFQSLYFEVQNLIFLKILPIPSRFIPLSLLMMLEEYMKDRGLIPPASRCIKRILMLAEVFCIKNALTRLFHMHGSPYVGKSITPEMLLSIRPYLFITVEQTIHATFTLISEIIPNGHHQVIKALREIWAEKHAFAYITEDSVTPNIQRFDGAKEEDENDDYFHDNNNNNNNNSSKDKDKNKNRPLPDIGDLDIKYIQSYELNEREVRLIIEKVRLCKEKEQQQQQQQSSKNAKKIMANEEASATDATLVHVDDGFVKDSGINSGMGKDSKSVQVDNNSLYQNIDEDDEESLDVEAPDENNDSQSKSKEKQKTSATASPPAISQDEQAVVKMHLDKLRETVKSSPFVSSSTVTSDPLQIEKVRLMLSAKKLSFATQEALLLFIEKQDLISSHARFFLRKDSKALSKTNLKFGGVASNPGGRKKPDIPFGRDPAVLEITFPKKGGYDLNGLISMVQKKLTELKEYCPSRRTINDVLQKLKRSKVTTRQWVPCTNSSAECTVSTTECYGTHEVSPSGRHHHHHEDDIGINDNINKNNKEEEEDYDPENVTGYSAFGPPAMSGEKQVDAMRICSLEESTRVPENIRKELAKQIHNTAPTASAFAYDPKTTSFAARSNQQGTSNNNGGFRIGGYDNNNGLSNGYDNNGSSSGYSNQQRRYGNTELLVAQISAKVLFADHENAEAELARAFETILNKAGQRREVYSCGVNTEVPTSVLTHTFGPDPTDPNSKKKEFMVLPSYGIMNKAASAMLSATHTAKDRETKLKDLRNTWKDIKEGKSLGKGRSAFISPKYIIVDVPLDVFGMSLYRKSIGCDTFVSKEIVESMRPISKDEKGPHLSPYKKRKGTYVYFGTEIVRLSEHASQRKEIRQEIAHREALKNMGLDSSDDEEDDEEDDYYSAEDQEETAERRARSGAGSNHRIYNKGNSKKRARTKNTSPGSVGDHKRQEMFRREMKVMKARKNSEDKIYTHAAYFPKTISKSLKFVKKIRDQEGPFSKKYHYAMTKALEDCYGFDIRWWLFERQCPKCCALKEPKRFKNPLKIYEHIVKKGGVYVSPGTFINPSNTSDYIRAPFCSLECLRYALDETQNCGPRSLSFYNLNLAHQPFNHRARAYGEMYEQRVDETYWNTDQDEEDEEENDDNMDQEKEESINNNSDHKGKKKTKAIPSDIPFGLPIERWKVGQKLFVFDYMGVPVEQFLSHYADPTYAYFIDMLAGAIKPCKPSENDVYPHYPSGHGYVSPLEHLSCKTTAEVLALKKKRNAYLKNCQTTDRQNAMSARNNATLARYNYETKRGNTKYMKHTASNCGVTFTRNIDEGEKPAIDFVYVPDPRFENGLRLPNKPGQKGRPAEVPWAEAYMPHMIVNDTMPSDLEDKLIAIRKYVRIKNKKKMRERNRARKEGKDHEEYSSDMDG